MKTVIQSLILLAAILLMIACKSKSSKHLEVATKAEVVVVDTTQFNLTSAVALSLAKEFEALVLYLNDTCQNIVTSSVNDGSSNVFSVYFYQDKGRSFLQVMYCPWYWESFPVLKPKPRLINGVHVDNAFKHSDYQLSLDGYIVYKDVMFAFYNLDKQGNAGKLVHKSYISKDKPSHFSSYEALEERDGSVPMYEGWGKLFEIHSRDSLELIKSGVL